MRPIPKKREIALSLIAKHEIAKDAAISAQVLQEFYVASTRRLGINPIEARQLVKDFQMFELVQVTPGIIDEAIDTCPVDYIHWISFEELLSKGANGVEGAVTF